MKKAQQVYPMIGILHDVIAAVPQDTELTPAGRAARIAAAAECAGFLDSVDVECRHATASLRLTTFSSYRKAQSLGLALPRAIARRSLAMLDTSWLDHNTELTHHAGSVRDHEPGWPNIVHPSLLSAVETPDGISIDYAPSLRAQLDARGPNKLDSCPAPRRTLERFYERYVDIVLPPDEAII